MKKISQSLILIIVIVFVFFGSCTQKTIETPTEMSVEPTGMVSFPEAYTDFLGVEKKLIECNVSVLNYGTIKGYYFDGIKLYLAFETSSKECNIYFASLLPKGESQLIKADAIYKYSDLPLFSEELQSKDGYLIIFNNLFGKNLNKVVLHVNDKKSSDFEIKGAIGEEKIVNKVYNSDSYKGELVVKSVVYGERTALLRCTLPENKQGTAVMIVYETDGVEKTKMQHNISCEILERNGQEILVQIPLDIRNIGEFTFVSSNIYSVEFSERISV